MSHPLRSGLDRHPSNASKLLKKFTTQRADTEDNPTATAAPQTHPPAANITSKMRKKQASSLMVRLENKLPCNSGNALSAVERDHVMEHIVVGLIQLAVQSPNDIVWSLCGLLEKLQKRTLPNDMLPEDVLDSELFVLKTLTRVLNSRWTSPVSSSSDPTNIYGQNSSVSSHLPSTSQPVPQPVSSSSSLPHIAPPPYIRAHKNNNLSQSSLRSDSTAVSSVEPAPLDDAIARYALSIARIFLRDDFNCGVGGGSQAVRELRSIHLGARASGSMFPWDVVDWEPALSSPQRSRKHGKDNDPPYTPNIAWEQTAFPVHGASDLGTFVQGGSAKTGGLGYTMYAHKYARDVALHGSYIASVAVLVTKYAGRIVFNLSASNWPIVFARISERLRVMADDTEFGAPLPPKSRYKPVSGPKQAKGSAERSIGTPERHATDDCVDLRLLSVCVMDNLRLKSVLQEFSKVFPAMSPFAQDISCIALQAAVKNWVENFSCELTEMWCTGGAHRDGALVQLIREYLRGLSGKRKDRMLNGFAERVFDILYDTSNQNMKRAAWLYPTLAALISISPERLESSVESLDGGVKLSDKNNFLEQLSNPDKVLSSSPSSANTALAEHAAIAYLDIVHAAFVTPPAAPGQEESALRVIGVRLASKLKRFMLQPPPPLKPFYASTDPIDVNFYAYCTAAVFRFHPLEALQDIIQTCLEPQRSAAVKLVAVKSLVLLIAEASKYPWQPSLEVTYPTLTPRLRSLAPALLAGRAESVDGIARPASQFPTCQSLVNAAKIPGLSSEIDEDVRLIVQVETLFALAPVYWAYGTTEKDHAEPNDDVVSILAPDKDKRAQAATMMGFCATIMHTLHCTPDIPWYSESMRCLYYIIPAAFASVSLLLLGAGGNDHEFHRSAATCLHTLLMRVAEGSPYDQDDSWRFSSLTMGSMPLVELALWTALSSSQMDISVSAQRCLRLIGVIERNPALAVPKHLTSDEFAKRSAVLEGLGDPRAAIVGRVAFLRRMCKYISMLSFPSPTHVMMFRQFLHRWKFLTPKIDYQTHGSGTEPPTKDEVHEWQNKMYILAVSGGCLLINEAHPFPEGFDAMLPPHLQGPVRPMDMVRQFLLGLVPLLSSKTLTVREAAKEAIGHELNMRVVPIFMDILLEETEKRLSNATGDPAEPTLVFLQQLLIALHMLFERMHSLDSVLENTIGIRAVLVARYITSLPFDIEEAHHLKSRFCAVVDILLSKRHLISTKSENDFRNHLVDILAGWLIQRTKQLNDIQEATESHRAAMDAHITGLKTFVRVVETLHIEALSENTPEHLQITSRQFYRYLTALINAHAAGKARGSFDSASEFEIPLGKSDQAHKNRALVNELVISGIAHLLNNNIEAGIKHCLALCYDEDIYLRVVILQAFTRVLNLGTKFEPQQVSSHVPQVTLCELLRDCERILLSLVEACPPGDVDQMVAVLLHVFNTRKSLMNLVEILIKREVSRTISPTELFRSNDLCIRLLSAFARQHGYVYLRSVLVHLIGAVMDLPVGCSFELDPLKMLPDEDPAANVQILMDITQAFIEVIVESAKTLPPVLREVCHLIGHVVFVTCQEDPIYALIPVCLNRYTSWPESKYDALGAFLFLRFICPAIVSPETVDIELSQHEPKSSSIRRGLILIAKIMQNLANNVYFAKETFLVVLNPFLEKNILPVTKYLSAAALSSPSIHDEEQTLGPGCDDTDYLVLHDFLQKHKDIIGKQLLSQKVHVSDGCKFPSGKDAWDALCAQLVEMGAAREPPHLSGEISSEHATYQRFMSQNRDRNTDALNSIFAPHTSIKGQAYVFTFARVDIDILDFELLIYLILKAINATVMQDSEFDIIFDFTEFTLRSELPVAWLRLALELFPSDFRRNWRSAYILNLNGLSQVFLRKMLYIFLDLELARETLVVSSVAELQQHLGEGFMMSSGTATLEYQKMICFDDVHLQMEKLFWNPVCLYIGEQHIRIVSIRRQQVSPTVSARIVEIVPLREIDDVYRGSDEHQLMIKRVRRDLSITLSSTSSEHILKLLQVVKQRAVSFKPASLPTSQVSDLSATLLAIGMLHACHQSEYVRRAAYELLTANCAYIRYPFDGNVPWRGSFIPANPLAFIIHFSERVSKFAPQMTFDFISEWSNGFSGASSSQKITCLLYISPWLRNLSSVFTPTSAIFDASGTKVRHCINIFMDIMLEYPELYPILQRTVWTELGKSTPATLDVIIEELIFVAMNSGDDSKRCELVADSLIVLPCIQTRARVLKALRMQVTNACSTDAKDLTETTEWTAISALSRLALVAGHSPRLDVQSQLYAPEIAHLVTMLAATGTLTMRSSIYGMTVNLLQALHAARVDDEAVAIQLRVMLDDLASPEILNFFGIGRHYPSSELRKLGPSSEEICVESLEVITRLLLRSLELGATSHGLRNVWVARWMGLVTSIAFQASFKSQSRAFTILGSLVGSAINDDIVYRMLVAFRTNILHSHKNNQTSEAFSMLRCMRKAIPGLPRDSLYLKPMFWLAVSLIQAGCTSYYAEAVQLLQVSVESMHRHAIFSLSTPTHLNPVVYALMEARGPLYEAATSLDHLSGLSFETDFGFSLVSILWGGVRVPADVKLLQDALYSLLTIAVHVENPESDRETRFDRLSTPLLMALAPCMSRKEFTRMLVDFRAIHPGRDNPVADEASILLDAQTITDTTTALLATGFLLLLDASNILDARAKENIHFYWAEVAKSYPDVFILGVLHFMEMSEGRWISQKLDTLFSYPSSPAYMHAITTCFDIFMSGGVYSPEETFVVPPLATTALNSGMTQSSASINDGIFTQLLIDIGMIGIVQPFGALSGTSDSDSQRDRAVQCFTALVDVIIT